MLKAKGRIVVQPKKGRIVLDLSPDFVKLYYWFITKHYWVRMGTPLHGAHITIYSSKHHNKVNWNAARSYHGFDVEFQYDPYLVEGGYRKGFIMYYLKVVSAEIEIMKFKLGIEDGPNYKGLHATIATSKGGNIFPDWPKTIELTNETLRTKT